MKRLYALAILATLSLPIAGTGCVNARIHDSAAALKKDLDLYCRAVVPAPAPKGTPQDAWEREVNGLAADLRAHAAAVEEASR